MSHLSCLQQQWLAQGWDNPHWEYKLQLSHPGMKIPLTGDFTPGWKKKLNKWTEKKMTP